MKDKFIPQVPDLDLSEGIEMLKDFSREAQKHLISARNSLLILEGVPTDKEAIESVFKTFHTIKGLSDFLNLQDIYCLTHEAEIVLDLTRKDVLFFNLDIKKILSRTVDYLQRLLELLDEQIAGDGELKSEYLDVSEVISALNEMTHTLATASPLVKIDVKTIPIIKFQADLAACDRVVELLAIEGDLISLDRGIAEKLVEDFQNTSKELKETQSKLQERQRELIKERELAIKLAKQSQLEARTISKYLANMSHEIRTLINAILGFADILKKSSLSGQQKDHINTISLTGQMLLGIVNDILDFSKVEAGKLRFEKIDFNLISIIEEVFKIIRTRLNKKNINLYYELDEDVPTFLVGDPTRLRQIFLNLLDNAIKFTEEGEIGLTISIEPNQKSVSGQVILRFSLNDSGIGIPADRTDSIFKSFTQAEKSTTRLYGGTGLGLALCKTIVTKMGGDIWVESKIGKGSQFIFNTRFNEVDSGLQQDVPGFLSSYKESKALIVGRDKRSTDKLLSLCQEISLDCFPVTDEAKEASKLLSQCQADPASLPRVIFIDVTLADKEGFMLAYKIKQNDIFKDIKLIAVSSEAGVEDNSDYQQAKFDTCLLKPIMRSEIFEALKKLSGEDSEEKVVSATLSSRFRDEISCEGIRVLVVEDSLPNQELLKVHFENLGCICDYASNGKEAVGFLENNKYDICFMDLQMPIMGGLEATEVIRQELQNDIPIVALTAAEVDEEKGKCLDIGMTDYLSKPFGVDELKEMLVKCTKM